MANRFTEPTVFYKDVIQALRAKERVLEIREVIGLITNNLAIPLYLAFWICDLIYVPEHKWLFLFLRLAVVPVCLFARYAANKCKSDLEAQFLCLAFIGTLASIINLMIYIIGEVGTPYYAGLNLVALGTLSFIPWSQRFYLVTVMLIYTPYFALGALSFARGNNITHFVIGLFFITGTIIVSFMMRAFNERLRLKETASRLQLQGEVDNRDLIIQNKTKEAVKLSTLSNQFSPQVVEAIRSNKIDFKQGVHRAEICAIFIDIVNSTERIARLDKDKINNTITQFMEDTVTTLLKYDITIDKFLGDGILAFSNDPIEYDDFVTRVVRSAFEIRSRLHSHREHYENNWMNELQIRVGISVGFANVGFYGSEKYFKTYTAIGPVINLASRMCSTAEANQIVVNHDVYERVKDEFDFTYLGPKQIKGFEKDLIKVYELKANESSPQADYSVPECPTCNSILFLTNDDSGIFVFKCRSCDYVMKNTPPAKKKAA